MKNTTLKTTSSNGQATTSQHESPQPTSTMPQTLSHNTTGNIQVGQERPNLIDKMKLIHHSLGLAIVGLKHSESREEIIPLLHAIRDSNEILQRQLHMILSDPKILLGYPHPMYEFPHSFDQCVYHLGSICEGPEYTASDRASKKKPEEHLDFVHKHLARIWEPHAHTITRASSGGKQFHQHVTVLPPRPFSTEGKEYTLRVNLKDWPHPMPRIQGPLIDLTLPDISPDLNPQSDTSEDLDHAPNSAKDTMEITAIAAPSHQSAEDALELLNLQVSMEDIVQTTTEPETSQATTATLRPETPGIAPSHEPPYTDYMGRPISPTGYAWQNNLPYDSDFDEAMEYDSSEPMEAPREWFRPPISGYQGPDDTATNPRFNEEHYSPPDDIDDF
ncbi:MAG: hypothetical protein M1816_005393 [Peltula sp. TS41687]|nr:MAG: hypothetical protein M1816_005393 [Peltula sp. TS41687]